MAGAALIAWVFPIASGPVGIRRGRVELCNELCSFPLVEEVWVGDTPLELGERDLSSVLCSVVDRAPPTGDMPMILLEPAAVVT